MPTELDFGPDALSRLAYAAGRYGQKPMVLTGVRSARANGALDVVLEQLPHAVIFDGVDENPGTRPCESGAALCRKWGCDVVIGLGGGSAIDVAKTVAVLARNDAPCEEYFGTDLFAHPPLPVVAVPTTAGTGTETTPYAVLVTGDPPVKKTIKGDALFPRLAILDPKLTLSLPRNVTVATGLDALSQAMEGYVSLNATAFGDVLALEICRLVRTWLPRAAEHPEDIEARAAMMHAAMLSGCVIAQSGTTLVHGMGYYLTLEYGVPHGLANGLLLAPVFRRNAQHQPERVAALAAALGVACRATAEAAAGAIADALRSLFRDLAVSAAAEDAGVRRERFDEFARALAQDRYRFKNQMGELSVDDLKDIFDEAFEGR